MQAKLLLRLLTWDARLAWSALGLPVLGLLLITSFQCDASTSWLYLGLLLQLTGIALVAKGIADTRRRFGKPSLAMRVRTWATAVVRAATRKRRYVLAAGTARFGMSAHGTISVASTRSKQTLKQRVAALEQAEREVRKAIQALKVDLKSAEKAIAAGLEDERNKRTEEVNKVRTLIDEHAAGDLSLDVVAVIWLLVGTIATTIPDHLPMLFGMCR